MKKMWIIFLVCRTLIAQEVSMIPVSLLADPTGEKLYVAGTNPDRVIQIKLSNHKVTHLLSTSHPPTGLALSPDGRRLYISCSGANGTVEIFDLGKKERTGILQTGHTPVSPVISPDGKRLYVCNRFNNSVSVIDLAENKELKKIPVMREPISAVITPDGNHLLVANHLPAGAANTDYIKAVVSVISTTGNEVTSIDLPNGSTSLRKICLSSDGSFAYVTHILARYQMSTTQLDRGWLNTNALSIIDVTQQRLLNTVLLDDVDLGAANPWGVACTADEKYICVSHAGTNELSIIKRDALHKKLTSVAKGEKVTEVSSSAENVPNDLSFLVGLRKRVHFAGKGPRDLAVIGSRVYTAEYFSGSIGFADLNSGAKTSTRSISLGNATTLTQVREGEMYFNDAKLCFQQWQSCASCHPDGRVDALNWDLLNDGIGNPKQVKSMLKAHQTPPAMITGIRPNAESAVRAGLTHIHFSVYAELTATAIDTYLNSMEPLESPYRIDGELTKSADQGEEIFILSGCSSCHSGPLYTNMQKHNVGTGSGRDENRIFDTPTLIEIWRTAPYLYDGRAASIREVITTYNKNDFHGRTSKLNEEEIDQLVEYILSQ